MTDLEDGLLGDLPITDSDGIVTSGLIGDGYSVLKIEIMMVIKISNNTEEHRGKYSIIQIRVAII